MMELNVFVLENENGAIHLLSPLKQSDMKGLSSRSELFAGQLITPEIGLIPGNVAVNKDFLVLLHEVVRDEMANDPQVIFRASEQPNGFVFIIDRRSPAAESGSEEKVDKEDIIGVFLCNDRKTDAGRYRPNPDYRLITEKGCGIFPEAVENKLLTLLLQSKNE